MRENRKLGSPPDDSNALRSTGGAVRESEQSAGRPAKPSMKAAGRGPQIDYHRMCDMIRSSKG